MWVNVPSESTQELLPPCSYAGRAHLWKLGCLPWKPSGMPLRWPCRGHISDSGTGKVTQPDHWPSTLQAWHQSAVTRVLVPRNGEPSSPLETASSVSSGGMVSTCSWYACVIMVASSSGSRSGSAKADSEIGLVWPDAGQSWSTLRRRYLKPPSEVP